MTGVERQDEEWICAVAANLSKGDEVVINERSRTLTVTGREKEMCGGSDYPYHRVWLEGNGTEYLLRYSHTHQYKPRLQTKGGRKRTVRHIETVGGETAIIADQSAEEFIEPTVPESSVLPDATPEERTADGDRLGDCPECDGTVVEDGDRAVCSDCDQWCWMAQWEAFSE